MPPLIYLLRHGEINIPSPRRFLGQSDLPLNDTGIRHAKQLGKALSTIGFRHIYASPLSRAMQTASLVSGRSIQDIHAVDAFLEINLGAWEGLSVAEVRQRFPGAYEERGQDLAHFRPPEGESFADVAARALPVLHDIARCCTGPVLIVAHAGVNRALLSSLQQLPLGNLLQIPQDYCAVNILTKEAEGLMVQGVNQIP